MLSNSESSETFILAHLVLTQRSSPFLLITLILAAEPKDLFPSEVKCPLLFRVNSYCCDFACGPGFWKQ